MFIYAFCIPFKGPYKEGFLFYGLPEEGNVEQLKGKDAPAEALRQLINTLINQSANALTLQYYIFIDFP